MHPTTEPDQAEQAYRRPDHYLRRQVEADVAAFLEAGGQIQQVDSQYLGYDAAGKEKPAERRPNSMFTKAG